MDYLTPWKPSLNGNTLNTCTLLRDLIENDEWPSFRRAEEKTWTAGVAGPELEQAREARDAILESVLVIWHLNMTQEHGGRGSGLAEPLDGVAGAFRLPFAGLRGLSCESQIRHRDLCQSIGIPPLCVIVDFVDAVRVMGLLPVAWIPAMSKPEEPPRRSQEPMTPAPSQTTVPAVATTSVAPK